MLKHLLSMADITNIIINCFVLLYFIVLIILPKIKKEIWKLLCLIPLVISIIHMIIFTSGSAFLVIFPSYLNMYIPTCLIALLPLFINKTKLFKVGKVLTLIICFICLFYPIVNPRKIVNYTRYDLRNSYIKICNYLEKNYILSDWKKIDYSALKEEGLKLVNEAIETGNIDKYYDALNNLVNAHYDGHMALSFYKDNDYSNNLIKEFNDYGLSLVKLDDGSVIAVNVEKNLEIKDSDTIIKWDGVPINEAIEKVNLPIGESVIDNERIMKTFYLSGLGGDNISVTYINSNNEEKTIKLNKMDSTLPRFIKSYTMFIHNNHNQEYEAKMLTDNIGYLKIPSEETNAINDSISYFLDNHTKAREMFRKDLRKLKNKGMTKLIIDTRNNKGGYDEVATSLASLFTKDKMYAYSLGIKNKTGYKNVLDKYVLKDGEFSDIEVLVLTNMRCGSAGDGMVLYLSRISNITIAGLTNPSGINQETGGLIYLPEGAVIGFPIGLTLDDNNNPNIDVDYTRNSRTPVDIKIPLNKESALKIFDGIDYELEWAINHLNN